MNAQSDALKREAATQAAALVRPGMVVGLGTGSTAAFMIEALIQRVRNEGLAFIGVPTSERSADQARQGGIKLADLADHPSLDLAIDGADQIARASLDLIKGMGGALLREKIIAAAAAHYVIIADESKLTDQLTLPIPVEVVRFGWQSTQLRLHAIGATTTLRLGQAGSPYITDGGNLILDCSFGPLANPATTDDTLHQLVGVIETGLFIGRTSEVVLATAGGVRVMQR